jgi:hypothetical protein
MAQRDTATVAVLFMKPAFVTTPKKDMGGILRVVNLVSYFVEGRPNVGYCVGHSPDQTPRNRAQPSIIGPFLNPTCFRPMLVHSDVFAWPPRPGRSPNSELSIRSDQGVILN